MIYFKLFTNCTLRFTSGQLKELINRNTVNTVFSQSVHRQPSTFRKWRVHTFVLPVCKAMTPAVFQGSHFYRKTRHSSQENTFSSLNHSGRKFLSGISMSDAKPGHPGPIFLCISIYIFSPSPLPLGFHTWPPFFFCNQEISFGALIPAFRCNLSSQSFNYWHKIYIAVILYVI